MIAWKEPPGATSHTAWFPAGRSPQKRNVSTSKWPQQRSTTRVDTEYTVKHTQPRLTTPPHSLHSPQNAGIRAVPSQSLNGPPGAARDLLHVGLPLAAWFGHVKGLLCEPTRTGALQGPPGTSRGLPTARPRTRASWLHPVNPQPLPLSLSHLTLHALPYFAHSLCLLSLVFFSPTLGPECVS